MSISQEKKNFIKKVAPGIHIYMALSYRADEIYINPENEVEKYIRDNLLSYEKSAIRVKRHWFSESLFENAVDTLPDEKLKELLFYLDNIDMPLCDVFTESYIYTKDLTENEKKYENDIMDGNLITFEQFLS